MPFVPTAVLPLVRHAAHHNKVALAPLAFRAQLNRRAGLWEFRLCANALEVEAYDLQGRIELCLDDGSDCL